MYGFRLAEKKDKEKVNGMKKRVFVPLIVMICCFGLLLVGCSAEKEADGDVADVVFENGTIFTADDADTVAEGVAIKDGKITYVGAADGLEAYKGSDTEIVDLEGQMLIPGMMDSHIHIPGNMFTELYAIDLAGVYTLEDTMKTIEDFVAANPDLDMYYGFAYNTTAFTEGDELHKGPSKERLDEIESEKPIAITAYDGHSMWLNSAAFEKFGITPDSEVATGGLIEVDDATGEVWGTLKETAMDLVPGQELSDEMIREGLDTFQKLMNSWGYTGITGATASGALSTTYWDYFKEMEEDGTLTLKMRGASYLDPDKELEPQFEEIKKQQEKYNSDWIDIGLVKIFADGVVDSKTAYMLEPYTDDPSTRGELLWDPDKLAEAIKMANENGIQAHTHCIGDAATTATLDAIEKAMAELPEGDYRNSITHLIITDLNDVPRMAELNVIASIQAYWIVKFPGYWDTVEYPFLGERAEEMYPLKSFVDAGVTLASSSDSPVTPYSYPFVAIEAGVTRNITDGYVGQGYEIADMDDPEWLLWPEQRVSVEDMIKSFTIGNAYLAFTDDVTGSIEVGKAADLVIIDQDILAVDPIEIENTQVVRTYLNGEVVYDKNAS